MRYETESGAGRHREGPVAVDVLLARIGRGDKEAFGEFYDALSPRVFGFVCRLIVDRARAEEVTQEVFVEIWQTAGRFDSNKGRASGWVFTIAHRRAVDRIRSAQADHDRDVRVGVRDHDAAFDNVAEEAESHLENQKVYAAMRSLTDLQREAVGLAFYGGLTHSEIAGHLNVPLGTVKTRLHDGMIRLRRELGVES